jgi:hypothetical protein
MIVVADSSPLRHLIALREQELLPRMFGETWLPSAVVKELSATGAPPEVRGFLSNPPGWLKVRDPGSGFGLRSFASLGRSGRDVVSSRVDPWSASK